jgi:hypothetical protein
MEPKLPRQPATIWERLRFLLLMQCSGARAVVTTELDMTGFLDANRRLVLAAAAGLLVAGGTGRVALAEEKNVGATEV